MFLVYDNICQLYIPPKYLSHIYEWVYTEVISVTSRKPSLKSLKDWKCSHGNKNRHLFSPAHYVWTISFFSASLMFRYQMVKWCPSAVSCLHHCVFALQWTGNMSSMFAWLPLCTVSTPPWCRELLCSLTS